MRIDSQEAVLVLYLMPDDIGFGDNWPLLLACIYDKRTDMDLDLPVEGLKSLIRVIPMDKSHIEFRRKIAFEILERSYPDAVPLSDEEKSLFEKLKDRVEEIDDGSTENDAENDTEEATENDTEEATEA